MTTQEKGNITALLLIMGLFILLIIATEQKDKIIAERDNYKAQCDYIDANFNHYKDSVESMLDTCFVIGKSNHKLQKYIRQ